MIQSASTTSPKFNSVTAFQYNEFFQIPPELETKMNLILGPPQDPIDENSFDPIEFINGIFPNEQSFAQADIILPKLKGRIKFMDKNIRDMLREQTDSELDGGVKELQVSSSSLSSLMQDIKDIREKAKHAEQTVQDITKDIKSLDCAKKNLTASITVLKRLQMISSAVDQLQNILSRKHYSEMAKYVLDDLFIYRLIPAIVQLSVQFQSFKSVKQINDLLERVNTMLADVKRMIFSDFEASFTTQGQLLAGNNVSTLQEACIVLDVLDEEAKKQITEWYCELQLREYRSVFRPSDEVGNLENLTRRYTKLQKICKTFDEEHAPIFPKHWKVSEKVCERFCSITKDDISVLLSKSTNIDVKLLISNLTETLKFEASLNRRFAEIKPQDDLESTKPSLEISNFFSGKISSSFEPFMKAYLDMEDRAVSAIVDKSKSQNSLAEEEGVFSASLDLFVLYRQTLKSMAELNTRKPFLELSKIFAKYLVTFCDVLVSKIPKEEKRAATIEELKITCFVLNTADYCCTTIAQLEDKLKEKCDIEYRDQIDLSKERETYMLVVTNSIQALVRQVSSCVYNALQAMTKIPWATMQTVGDQSEYVNVIAASFHTNVKLIRRTIRNQKHFKWFCDKFVDSFIPWFYKSIHNCKPISEVGAEQLLLDTMAIKSLLLDLPNIGGDEKIPVSAVYTRFVVNGISKVETLLKVVLTPLDPAEGLIKNYLILYVEANEDDESSKDKDSLTVQKITELREGLLKILDLKGVKKPEQLALVELLNTRLSSSRGAVVPSLLASLSSSQPTQTTSSTIGQNATAALNSIATGLSINSAQAGNTIKSSMNEAGNRISENFKRFTTFNLGVGNKNSK